MKKILIFGLSLFLYSGLAWSDFAPFPLSTGLVVDYQGTWQSSNLSMSFEAEDNYVDGFPVIKMQIASYNGVSMGEGVISSDRTHYVVTVYQGETQKTLRLDFGAPVDGGAGLNCGQNAGFISVTSRGYSSVFRKPCL